MRPDQTYELRLTGNYSVPLSDTISGSLSGHYQSGGKGLAVNGDRYGLDFSLAAKLSQSLSASLTAGYSNTPLLQDFSSASDSNSGFRAGFRISWRPDDTSHVDTSYDSQTHTAGISGGFSQGQGRDQWDGSAGLNRSGDDGHTSVSGSLNYAGNRFDARVSHLSDIAHGDLHRTHQRSSVRASAAIAFADGKIAVGAPVRGNAFAIVYPHESIAGKTITVGDKDNPRAQTDALGPALVTDLPAYANASLGVDVDDLPAGYSLGQGTFDMKAPYRAGYALQVGSAYSVSAYGVLVTAAGEPAALLTGAATSKADGKKRVEIFTNAAGKFGADGLAPGHWLIELAAEATPVRYEFDIPPGTSGLFKAGTLKPVKE